MKFSSCCVLQSCLPPIPLLLISCTNLLSLSLSHAITRTLHLFFPLLVILISNLNITCSKRPLPESLAKSHSATPISASLLLLPSVFCTELLDSQHSLRRIIPSTSVTDRAPVTCPSSLKQDISPCLSLSQGFPRCWIALPRQRWR